MVCLGSGIEEWSPVRWVDGRWKGRTAGGLRTGVGYAVTRAEESTLGAMPRASSPECRSGELEPLYVAHDAGDERKEYGDVADIVTVVATFH